MTAFITNDPIMGFDVTIKFPDNGTLYAHKYALRNFMHAFRWCRTRYILDPL